MASHWVRQFILTTRCTLAVQFRRSGLCIEYPGSTRAMFQQAIVSDPGKYIWQLLYRKLPYKVIKLPCPPGQTTLCCPSNPIPSTLHATFSNGTLGSACLNGVVVALTYTGTDWHNGNFAACSQTNNGGFQCNGLLLAWTISFPTLALSASADAGGTCAPFLQTFSGAATSLGGTVKITVTT